MEGPKGWKPFADVSFRDSILKALKQVSSPLTRKGQEIPTIVGRKIEEIDENSLGMFCDEQCGVTRKCHRVRLKKA